MKLPRRHFLHLAAGAAALPVVSRVANAQSYPTRPVRLIVPFAAGGGTDITARVMGQWLSERLGQQFVIDNRPGGGTNIGTEAVVRAPADGYTLLLAGSPAAINATLYDKLNYNFIPSRRSQASSASLLSWRSIHRFRPRRFPSSLPMPRLIRAGSTWRPPAPAPAVTLRASCSR